MSFFVNEFLGRQRKNFLNAIKYVECYSGGWVRGTINRKEVVNDELVIDATFPALDSRSATITAIRLIDVTGSQCAYQDKSIKKDEGQGTFIRVSIPFKEE